MKEYTFTIAFVTGARMPLTIYAKDSTAAWIEVVCAAVRLGNIETITLEAGE
jgi:hypothetical protein